MNIKIFFFYTFFLLSATTYSQQKPKKNEFILKGRLLNKDTGRISLWYSDSKNIYHRDTIDLKNGKFYFEGSVDGVCEAILWTKLKNNDYDDKSVIRFLLEPSDYFISFKESEEPKIIIIGGITQSEKNYWDNKKKDLVKKKSNLRNRLYSLHKLAKTDTSKIYKDIIAKEGFRLDSISEKIKKKDIEYIKNHPQSNLSAYLLTKHNRRMPLDTVQKLYQAFSKTVKKTSIGKELLGYIYPLTNDEKFKASNPMIDEIFDRKLNEIKSIYDFKLKNDFGKDISLESFKGKYIVLDFWASWCKPCIENIPSLKEMINKYQFDSIQFISISLDTDIVQWKLSLRKHDFDGIQLSEPLGFKSLIAVYCKTLWVGHYVIINKSGQIINFNAPSPSDPQLKKIIDDLLNKKSQEI